MSPKTASKGAKKTSSKAKAASTEQTGNKKRRTEDPDDSISQILAGVEEFSGMFTDANEYACRQFWASVKQRSLFYTDQSLNAMRGDDVMCDVTLLVGPQKEPFRVHRVILAAAFEYFKVMFTSEMKESKQDEIHVPCVSPEDMELLLDFVYKGETDIHQKNVHNIAILANYFGAQFLLDQCCKFKVVSQFKNEKNSTKLAQFAERFKIHKLKVSLITEDLTEIKSLSAELIKLPMEWVWEVIRHPAAVICDNDPGQNEEMLFQMMMARLSSEDERRDHVTKFLEAVHLPQVSSAFLDTIQTQFGHIPGVRDLIEEAKKEVDPAETREWYLPRYKNKASAVVSKQEKPIAVVDGHETKLYSPCVLVQGFPFFFYALENGTEKTFSIESPVKIEDLGLPYNLRVSAEFSDEENDLSFKQTYYTGKVEKVTDYIYDDDDDADDDDHDHNHNNGYEIRVKVERC